MHKHTVEPMTHPDVFHILADPTKRKILDLVREREWSVGELVNYFGLPQPAVSKHLRALREANMVDVRVDGQRRWYRLRADSLEAVGDWIEPYRSLWQSPFPSSEGEEISPVELASGRVPEAD